MPAVCALEPVLSRSGEPQESRQHEDRDEAAIACVQSIVVVVTYYTYVISSAYVAHM